MAKQCPNCQQLLDEKARFCPICGTQVSEVKPLDAPIEIAENQLPPPLIPEAPNSIQTPSPHRDLPPLPSVRTGLIKPAFLAGVILGVTSSLPYVNCCCWLWIVGAGVLAVYFFRNETPGEIAMGVGARLGLLTGMFGAVFWQILDLPISYIYGPERVRQIREMIENAPNLPAESVRILEWLIELLHDPFNPALILFGFLSKLFICGVFTTIGGILGVAFFGKPKSSPL
jgi:Double zinc ribbon